MIKVTTKETIDGLQKFIDTLKEKREQYLNEDVELVLIGATKYIAWMMTKDQTRQLMSLED